MTDIFIVEDHPKMRETYALFFKAEPDFEICGMVASGMEALAQIPPLKPDLVIVDLSLPDIDGLEVVQRLRAQLPSLPILVVSGYHANKFSDRVAEAGADGYLNKQHAYGQLIPLIRDILERTSTSASWRSRSH